MTLERERDGGSVQSVIDSVRRIPIYIYTYRKKGTLRKREKKEKQ